MAEATQKARRRKRGTEHEEPGRERGEAEEQDEQGGDEPTGPRGTVEGVTEGARKTAGTADDTARGAVSGVRPIETPGPEGSALRHRLWPHRHGTDGMFVVAFERSS